VPFCRGCEQVSSTAQQMLVNVPLVVNIVASQLLETPILER